jgi:hypothetical protein
MKQVNKIPEAQKKLAQSYINNGYKVQYDIDGIHIYIQTAEGLELKFVPMKRKRSTSPAVEMKRYYKNKK